MQGAEPKEYREVFRGSATQHTRRDRPRADRGGYEMRSGASGPSRLPTHSSSTRRSPTRRRRRGDRPRRRGSRRPAFHPRPRPSSSLAARRGTRADSGATPTRDLCHAARTPPRSTRRRAGPTHRRARRSSRSRTGTCSASRTRDVYGEALRGRHDDERRIATRHLGRDADRFLARQELRHRDAWSAVSTKSVSARRSRAWPCTRPSFGIARASHEGAARETPRKRRSFGRSRRLAGGAIAAPIEYRDG